MFLQGKLKKVFVPQRRLKERKIGQETRDPEASCREVSPHSRE